jgi:hypothetical protein
MIGIPAVISVGRDLYGSEHELCTAVKYLQAKSSFFRTRPLPSIINSSITGCIQAKCVSGARNRMKENEMKKKCFDV